MVHCNETSWLDYTSEMVIHITNSSFLSAEYYCLRKSDRVVTRCDSCKDTREISLLNKCCCLHLHNVTTHIEPLTVNEDFLDTDMCMFGRLSESLTCTTSTSDKDDTMSSCTLAGADAVKLMIGTFVNARRPPILLNAWRKSGPLRRSWQTKNTVSYTHLTLPTIYSV